MREVVHGESPDWNWANRHDSTVDRYFGEGQPWHSSTVAGLAVKACNLLPEDESALFIVLLYFLAP
jgi:hypothetical protein